MSPVFVTELNSPLGPLTLTSNGAALTGLFMRQHAHWDGVGQGWQDGGKLPVLKEAARQLTAYFASELKEFDLPLAANGTEFQRRVWQALEDIPFGRTESYGELAARVGNPKGSRAVGLANGRNPISIVVPCHRVIGANGALTGYGGGLERKLWLLRHEGSWLA